jgi:hypothetical protein
MPGVGPHPVDLRLERLPEAVLLIRRKVVPFLVGHHIAIEAKL